jgi:hypothetical protein
VALAMINALDVQIAPLDRELRPYARRQTGCKALIAAHYGIGELCALTILAELGDCTRFSSSREAVRYGGMDITVYQSDRHRAPGAPLPPRTTSAALGAVRGRATRTIPEQPRPRLVPRGGRTAGRQPRLPGARAQAAQALLPHAARTRRGRACAAARRAAW